MKKTTFILGTIICCTIGMTSCATKDLTTEAYKEARVVEETKEIVTTSQAPIQTENQTETLTEEKEVTLNSEGESSMNAEDQVTENQEISNEETSTSEQVNNQSQEIEAEREAVSVSNEVAESSYIMYQTGNVITIIRGTACPTDSVKTQAPSITCKPTATVSATKTPEATKQPVVTKTPEVTKQPVVTKTPEATKQPVVTKTPVVTSSPEATKQPTATKTPEVTKAPTASPEATKAPSGGSSDQTLSSYASQVLALINEERAKAGLKSLTTTTALTNAADKRAEEIVSNFSHTRPNGTSGVTVLSEYSISYMAWGENIAYGQQTPTAVMEAWMNSSGHRANILSSKFGKVGIGCYKKNGVLYWTQVFTN